LLATGVKEATTECARHASGHEFATGLRAGTEQPDSVYGRLVDAVEALGHSDANGRPDPTLVWKRYGHLYPGFGARGRKSARSAP
jgi:hypothetical protein